MIKNEKEFKEVLTELVERTCVLYSKRHTIRTYRDIERLYTGNACCGYVTPSLVVMNLKQSYCILGGAFTRETSLKFQDCQDYADTALKGYSIFSCGRKTPVIDFTVFRILLKYI